MSLRTRTKLEPRYEKGFVQGEQRLQHLDDVVSSNDLTFADNSILKGQFDDQLDHVYRLALRRRDEEAIDFLDQGIDYLESILHYIQDGRLITTKAILEEFRPVPGFVFQRIARPHNRSLWEAIDSFSGGKVTHYCDLHFDIRTELSDHLFDNDRHQHEDHIRLLNKFRNSPSSHAQRLRRGATVKNVSSQDINLYVAAIVAKKSGGATTTVLTGDTDLLHQGPFEQITSKNQRKKYKVPSKISVAPSIDISTGVNRYGIPRSFVHYENRTEH